MAFFREVRALLVKEVQLEWKQKYALNGLLMYALSMVFVVALVTQGKLPPQAWNAVFWIMLLFVAVNAVAKSFMGETTGQLLYLYNLASARSIIGAKLLYNCLLLTFISMITVVFSLLFSGNSEIGNPLLYIVYIIAGSFGFAGNLTLVSAIASRAQNKSTLLAVLSFPLVVPQLLVCIVGSGKAIQGMSWADSFEYLVFSAGLFGIIAVVSFILFPFLWRE